MWWMYPCTLGSHSQDRAKSIWHDRVLGRNGCEHPMSFVQTYDAVILMIVRNGKRNAEQNWNINSCVLELLFEGVGFFQEKSF